MAWTTLYHQESRTEIWRESNEGKLSLTLGTPGFTGRRLESPEDKVSLEEHETCRGGAVKLRYLTKHSRQDICNPVRELSKTMDAPSPVHLKEMYKVISFVLSTKNYGLKFELRKDMMKWALKALRDSDFASDKNKDKCIWVHYLLLRNPNCLEKQRDEKCCIVNN